FSLIGKIITAPFQLLAGAFGGGEQDISFVDFTPGTADLAAVEESKLDVLGRALQAKEELSLVITGQLAGAADGPALRAAILREEMLQQLRGSAPAPATLSDDLYRQGIL